MYAKQINSVMKKKCLVLKRIRAQGLGRRTPPPKLPLIVPPSTTTTTPGCKQSFGLTVNYILSFDIFSCHFF